MGQALSSVPQHDGMSTRQRVNLPDHVSLLEDVAMSTQQHVNQHVPQHDGMSTCQHASLPKHVPMSSRQHVSLPEHVNLPQHDVNLATCKLTAT